jgi:hypothetical protein
VVEHSPHNPKLKGSCPLTFAGTRRENKAKMIVRLYLLWASSDSTVVEHSPHTPRFKGSCPVITAASTGREIIAEK